MLPLHKQSDNAFPHAAASRCTAQEYNICAQLTPTLQRDGLIFVGIDVIGGYLTEVNVTVLRAWGKLTAYWGQGWRIRRWNE